MAVGQRSPMIKMADFHPPELDRHTGRPLLSTRPGMVSSFWRRDAVEAATTSDEGGMTMAARLLLSFVWLGLASTK